MSKFLSELNRSYKTLLSEQVPPPNSPQPPMPDMAAAAPPMPPMPSPGGTVQSQEQPIETPVTRSVSDAFLIGMIAKALLIDVDDDDKNRIVKYLKALDTDNAGKVEENLVNIINGYDYQNIDEDLGSEFKISPKKARKVLKFIKNVMEKYVDTETSGEE